MRIIKVLQALICTAIITVSCKQSRNNKLTDNEYFSNDSLKWETLMIDGYQKFNSDRSVEAADQIFEATELMPNKNLENYLVSAMVYAPEGELEKAFLSIDRAINEGFKNSDMLSSISEYSSLYNDPRWTKLISKTNKKRAEYEKTVENVELLKMLKHLWAKDQEVLTQYEKNLESLDSLATNKDYNQLFTPVEKRWDINKNKLDSIIEIHGWPGNKLVGEEGAKVAWGIPQHHPNIFFKRRCLLILKDAVENGDVDPNHYAQLYDRIARETWQKQLYGTSMRDDAPFPIKDPKNINKRRSKLGLIEPIEVYAIYHGFKYEPPSKKEIESIYKQAQDHYSKFEEFLQSNHIDSANVYISKAISAHGDISNEQLYNASIKLAQLDSRSSQRKSMRILKVLIWRKWESRFEILLQNEFKKLKDRDEWKEIQNLIERSK